ncbi:hypothetical protein Ctob_013771 [Chrysochromulina tobinii]|uniref:Uncharacterized protein n=1 Tax=Chrysochromulina tobinii TaxID=1460289 RepID=A0A0M0K3R8_9EUKA|nr:hypothetical protein Ctob_013771 [Chrysochromulina tobinii]|eukprot:KOO33450.1 hypothetical protein Ctob_013771 [Chrysochromulina sp. CCMP291]
MAVGRESSGKGALTPVTRAGGLHPRQSLPVALSPAFCCMLSSTAAGCSAGGRWPGTRPGWADCEALEHGVGQALARVSRGVRANEGSVAKRLAAHRSLTSAERPCRRTGTTVESRYVRIGAVCRFILFCMPIAAFSAEDA